MASTVRESAAASRDVGYGFALRCPGAAVEQRGSDAVVEQCGAPERPRALALPASMFDGPPRPPGRGVSRGEYSNMGNFCRKQLLNLNKTPLNFLKQSSQVNNFTVFFQFFIGI